MCQLERAAPPGDIFHRKLDERFKELQNVFEIADDFVVLSYDYNGMGHKSTLRKVLQICREVSLKQKKYKCHFRCSSVPFMARS